MSSAKQIPERWPAQQREEQSRISMEEDERWLLVQRILASSGFQRAAQLRNILTYTTTAAILRPEEGVREYEIACDVLGRRGDFDPVSDNIVRSQMSHLRKKLEQFYAEEGQAETIRVTFPKGSYVPLFQAAAPLPAVLPEQARAERQVSAQSAAIASRDEEQAVATARWKFRFFSLAGLFILSLAALAFLAFRSSYAPSATKQDIGPFNEFVQFLARTNGNVSIVPPDTSLVMIEDFLDKKVTIEDYARSNFLQAEIDAVPDAEVRRLLRMVQGKRNTSAGEAFIASDFQEQLGKVGVSNKLRYTRDLRVRDFDEGNSILIGSHKSNPWVGLFEDRLNFRFVKRASDQAWVYANTHPLPGETSEYVPYVREEGGKMTSYADVALTPNLTQSGYVLIISGSDSPAAEASARFLLHGALPASVTALLSRGTPSYFEIFLRGKHVNAEGEEQFEVISVRSSPNPASPR